jgi:hypothetical protein
MIARYSSMAPGFQTLAVASNVTVMSIVAGLLLVSVLSSG